MLLISHILIALSSIIYAGIVMLFPSKIKLYFSYGFIAMTLVTGTILIISKPSHMVQSCLVGLLYLGVVSTTTVFAHKKLSTKSTL